MFPPNSILPAPEVIMRRLMPIDDFQVQGCEVYWLCRTRQSDSKFNNVRFEKMLNVRATWRGMNTIQRLIAKYAPSS
jgi:hypothetical protein